MVVIQGKHGANDTYLVFDPMRRDGKTDGSGIFETDCASVSYFEYLQQVADFVARRFANLSVTQFSFSIVATNGSGGTSGGDTKTSEKEGRDGEEESQLDPSLRLRRMAREKANTQKLNLKAKLISSRRRSVFKSNIMSGAIEGDEGGGSGGSHASKAALQSFKHWRTLYLSMFQGIFVFLTLDI